MWAMPPTLRRERSLKSIGPFHPPMAGPGIEDYIRRTELDVDPETYSILRLSDDARLEARHTGRALAWFRAKGDHTLVVPLEELRTWKEVPGLIERDDGWRRITLGVDVPLNQSGFLQPFADALAHERISILPLSGYRRDHLLVHSVNLERALAALERVKRAPSATAPVR